jgi:hypothetical protein
LTPGVFEARRRCLAMRRVCSKTAVQYGLDVREGVSDDVVLSNDVSYVCRELGHKIEVVALPRRAFVPFLVNGVCDGLVDSESCTLPACVGNASRPRRWPATLCRRPGFLLGRAEFLG